MRLISILLKSSTVTSAELMIGPFIGTPTQQKTKMPMKLIPECQHLPPRVNSHPHEWCEVTEVSTHGRSHVFHRRPQTPDVELGNRQKQEHRKKQVVYGKVWSPGSFQNFKAWTEVLGWHWLKTESTLGGCSQLLLGRAKQILFF